MNRFYVWGSGEMDGPYDTDFSKSEDRNLGEALLCPECGSTVSLLQWLPPYRAHLKLHGKDFGDFAHFGADVLISSRVADAFRSEGLSGFEGFHPVEVTRVRGGGRKGKDAPQYFYVRVMLGGASIDEKRSGVVWMAPPACPLCRSPKGLGGGIETAERVILEEGTWTGADVFEAWGLPGERLASARFRDFCRSHGFTNIAFAPAEEFPSDWTADGEPKFPRDWPQD